jgi:5-methylcytosine-specific restriction endonuclease McrA
MDEARCRSLVTQRALIPWSETEYGGPPGCEGCGTLRSISFEMHHRRFRSRGGLWVPSNVILLCKRCHDGAGGELLWAQFRGYNVHTWEDTTQVPVQLWWSDRPVLLDDVGGVRSA